MKDLTGERFGRLVVVNKVEGIGRKKDTHWECICDCGGTKVTTTSALVKGRTQSCGCLWMEARKARADDLAGQRFGRLVVIERDESKCRTAWLCHCDCGSEVATTSLSLKSGNTFSCGCYQRDRAAEAKTKHGLCYTRRYGIWEGMIQRCENPNSDSYERYGGRGICICKEWRENFMSFYTWAGDNGYEGYLSIDRIDNDGNYEPFNCRWVTTKEQNRNTRSNVYAEINGETKTLSEWSESTGVGIGAISGRFKRGVRGDALLAPANKNNSKKTDRERLYSIFYGIKARCHGNPNSRSYKDYGGRGISVCEEWLNDFNIFYRWALDNGYKENLTLDRIDINGNYCPENCRWATMQEQSMNRRNTVYLTYKGETMVLSEWARRLGVHGHTIRQRMAKGMPEDKIFYNGNLGKLKRIT